MSGRVALLVSLLASALAFLALALPRRVRTRIDFQPTAFNKWIVGRMGRGLEFRAPGLLRWSLAQTVWATVARRAMHVPWHRELVDTDDGGQLALDWTTATPHLASRVLVVVPGVTGCSESVYVRQLVALAMARGWHAVVLTFRGLGHLAMGQSPMITCGADRRDVCVLMERVAHRTSLPSVVRVAVGFSMGGNLLVNYVGEQGSQQQGTPPILNAAISVSNPFDFPAASRKLHSSLSGRFISRRLATGMKSILQRHVGLVDHVTDPSELDPLKHPPLDAQRDGGNAPVQAPRYCLDAVHVEGALRADTIQDFDEAFTRRVCGYSSLYHYYHSASSKRHLPTVPIPLLILSSRDDMFICSSAFPYGVHDHNDRVIVVETELGGHVAHVDGFCGGPSWAERLCVAFADGVAAWAEGGEGEGEREELL